MRQLRTVISLLQNGSRLPEKYIVNRIPKSGEGWFECYLFRDEQRFIIMYFRIYENCIYLCRVGTPEML
jgi:mRNA-degrading endonuclease YafQ of YafQ-DinJ toxin-antitoxin module